MPETPSPEEIKKDLGVAKSLYKKYGPIIKGAIAGIIFGGGTMLGIWEGYSKPQMYDIVDEEIEKYAVEEEKKKESFRGGLAKELGIEKEDVIDYVVAELDTAQRFINEAQKFRPYLERESSVFRIGYYIELENGEQGWYGPDLQPHRLAWEEGKPWVIYHGHRKDLNGW